MQGYSKILGHSSENESYWEDLGALVLRGHCHSKNDDFFSTETRSLFRKDNQ